jgi:hypothetical protein
MDRALKAHSADRNVDGIALKIGRVRSWVWGVSAKASAAALDGKQRMREDTRGRFWRRKAVIARELDVSYPLVDDPS